MLNRCEFIGNVGKQPEVKSMNNGDQVANFSLACTEKWKSKDGQPQEKTEWVNVVVFGKLCGVIERYVNKGSKLYVSGQLATRSWESDGKTNYRTEVVLRGFGGQLVMLDGKSDGQPEKAAPVNAGRSTPDFDGGNLDDEIPF